MTYSQTCMLFAKDSTSHPFFINSQILVESEQVVDSWLPTKKLIRVVRTPYNLMDYTCVATMAKPISFMKALQKEDAEKWKAIVDEEYKLMKNNTCELIKLPQGRKAIGCKWVFRIKRKANGEIDKYHVQLVAKGFS